MPFRLAAAIALASLAIGAAPVPQKANLGTAIAECHGEYDYAQLLPPAPQSLGHDTKGITLFGEPVTYLLSNYSNEQDEEIYKYTSGVALDYATLRQKALAFHGASACTQEVATPGKRSCTIAIAKPRSGKKFAALVMTIEERKIGTAARCTLRL